MKAPLLPARSWWTLWLVLAAAAGMLLLWAWYWAGSRGTFVRAVTVRLLTPNAQNIYVGEQVRLSGVRIGEVAEVDLDANAAVHIALHIDGRYAPLLHRDARASLESESMLGGSYIAVNPGGKDPGLVTGGDAVIAIAADSANTRELIAHAVHTLDQLQELVATLDDPNAELRGGLREARALLAELRTTRTQLDATLASVRHLTDRQVPRTLAQVDATLTEARTSLVQADRSLEALQAGGGDTLQDFRKVAADARARLAAVEVLLQHSEALVGHTDSAVQAARTRWPFKPRADSAPDVLPAPQAPAADGVDRVSSGADGERRP